MCHNMSHRHAHKAKCERVGHTDLWRAPSLAFFRIGYTYPSLHHVWGIGLGQRDRTVFCLEH